MLKVGKAKMRRNCKKFAKMPILFGTTIALWFGGGGKKLQITYFNLRFF